MAVKIEHTVAGHNHNSLHQCIFDVHASQSMGPQPDQKFCPSKLICMHGKLNKSNVRVFSVIFILYGVFSP